MGERANPISRHYTAGKDIVLSFDCDKPITDMTPRFVVSRKPGGTPVLSTETSPATAVAAITDGAEGVFTVTVDGDDTADLVGTYRFGAEVEDSSGDKSVVSHGFITFSKPTV